ncbi:MAG TPA: Clp protease ClpP [Smithellaceae bacterium]|jgi:ATP-dependent Clp endopeptidase proteolytic subunit ClpP|nr:Clp protease ClpP [Smithellaceae bacterium]HRS90194.1 Clp protease ClpP [Smithellaceae bacterium]
MLKYRNIKNAEATAKFWGKTLTKQEWYKIEAAANDNTEILVYDVIGWPFIEADAFVRDLASIKSKKITLRINSPGGDVFDGVAIFNALKNKDAEIITRVEGLAASIASIIALAGDEIQMHKSAMYMIHDPWVLVAGNQHDLRDIADVLAKIGDNMLDIYYDKVGGKKRELKQLMKDETWFKASEAKEFGLIDTVLETEKKVNALFDLSMFANAPEEIKTEIEGRDLTLRELERALRDAGASRSYAARVAAGSRDISRRDSAKAEKLETLINLIRGGK